MLSRKVAAMLVVSSSRCLAIAEPPFRARRGSIRVLPFGLSSTGRTTRRLVAHRAPRADVGGAMVAMVTMADGAGLAQVRGVARGRAQCRPPTPAQTRAAFGASIFGTSIFGARARRSALKRKRDALPFRCGTGC